MARKLSFGCVAGDTSNKAGAFTAVTPVKATGSGVNGSVANTVRDRASIFLAVAVVGTEAALISATFTSPRQDAERRPKARLTVAEPNHCWGTVVRKVSRVNRGRSTGYSTISRDHFRPVDVTLWRAHWLVTGVKRTY